MKVDFLSSFDDFKTLTENHHIFLYQIKSNILTIRAGKYGYKVSIAQDAAYEDALSWAKEYAMKVSESIPEELVFA